MAFMERDEYPEDESVEIIKLVDVRTSTQRTPAAMFAMPPVHRLASRGHPKPSAGLPEPVPGSSTIRRKRRPYALPCPCY